MRKKKSVSPIDTVVSLIKMGYNKPYILNHLLKTNDNVTTEEEGKGIIKQAELFLTTEHENNLNRILQLHKGRYNREINRLLTVEEGNSKIGRNKKIKAFYNALQTMAQLQHLLQITSDSSFSVDLNDQVQINIQDVKPKYDVKKLNFEEQLELYHLIMKSKKDENVPESITEAILSPIPEVVDIPFELVETPNVEQIKHEEIASEPFISPITFSDPTELLRKRLKEIAAKEIARVGGKLTDEEKQYLKN